MLYLERGGTGPLVRENDGGLELIAELGAENDTLRRLEGLGHACGGGVP